MLESALLVVFLVVMTRGLHLDGFMDSCDALFGGHTRERRLEIMRDPHVGAFAVAGVVCLLIIKCAAVAGLVQPLRLHMLILFPCLSRWAMLLVMELYPYARSEGLGTAFLGSGGRLQLFFGFICALFASLLAAGVMGLILLLAASLVAWAIGAWAIQAPGRVDRRRLRRGQRDCGDGSPGPGLFHAGRVPFHAAILPWVALVDVD